MPKTKLTLQERFWNKVNLKGPIPDDRPHLGNCWVWTGAHVPQGYGSIQHDGRQHPAHRISWLLSYGVMPTKHINHLCRNRSCVRPSHLEDVSNRENLLDSPITKATVNAAKTHCPQGHPYSPENTRVVGRGLRQCIICVRERSREAYRRKNGVVKTKGQYAKTIAHEARVMGG